MMAGVYFVFRPAQLVFQEILEYWDSVLIPLVAAKFPAVIVLLRGGGSRKMVLPSSHMQSS